jgi:hypothetical protein
MALTYPLVAPSSPSPRRVQPKPAAVVGMSASPFTGTQQLQAHQGEWWLCDLDLPPMTRAQAAAWVGMFMGLNYREGTFLLVQEPSRPLGIATGAPVVNGAGQTGKTLLTRGWTASKTGILKAADYFSLGTAGSTSLHQVVRDADSDGSGHATLEIWPRIRSAPADGAVLTVINPQGRWRLKDPFTHTIDLAMIFGVSVSLIEAL